MSQCEIIKQRLEQEPNTWVPMTTLARLAKCYAVNSRVSDLRKLGLEIGNKTEKVNGQNHSYYKLIVNEKQLSLL